MGTGLLYACLALLLVGWCSGTPRLIFEVFHTGAPQFQAGSRSLSASGALGASFYVFGGQSGTSALQTTEFFNALSDSPYWASASNLPEPTAGHVAVTFDSKIWLFYGWLTEVLTFDGSTYTAVQNSTLPCDDAKCLMEAAAAVTGPIGTQYYVWITGGYDGTATSIAPTRTMIGYRYDTSVSNGVFSTESRLLNTARYAHAMVSIGGDFYVIGGTDASGDCLGTMEKFTTVPDLTMPTVITGMTARCNPTAVVLNDNYIVVMGGSTSSGTVDYYDLGTQTWTTSAGNGFQSNRADALAEVILGRLFLAGGSASNSLEFTDEQEAYTTCYTDIGVSYPNILSFPFYTLPWRTIGFSFTAEVTMSTVTCFNCIVFAKTSCSSFEGGLQLLIINNKWAVSYLPHGPIYFTGLGEVSQNALMNVIFTVLPSSNDYAFTLSVNGASQTLSGIGSVARAESPFHPVTIGAACASRTNPFIGTIANIAVGACNTVTTTNFSPGYGSADVPFSETVSITVSSPTVAVQSHKSVTFTPTTGSTISLSGAFFFQSATTATTSTFTAWDYGSNTAMNLTQIGLEEAMTYTVTVDRDFVASTDTYYTGIASGYWQFGTKGQYPLLEQGASWNVVLDMPVDQWVQSAFVSAVADSVLFVPQSNVVVTSVQACSTCVTFRFGNMAPGSTEIANGVLEAAILDESFDGRLVANGLGATVHGATFTPQAGALPFHWMSVVLTPDTTDSPMRVTMTVTTNWKDNGAIVGLHAGGFLEITFPIEWKNFMPTTISSYTVTVDTYPSTSGARVFTPERVKDTTLEVDLGSATPWAINVQNGEKFTLAIDGLTMPSTCDRIDHWVYALKSYPISTTQYTQYILINPPDDTCNGKRSLIFGDPHFESFSGGSYDVNGKANFFYNIISDVQFSWNARFVSRNPRGHGTMHTYIGDSAFLINGTRIMCDPVKWVMYMNGKEVKVKDERLYLHNNRHYVKLTDTIMYIRAPGFFIALKHVLKDHGKVLAHFDHVVTLTDEVGGRTKPHGLLGQTALFTAPVAAKGHQGEGVIHGHVSDYEVPTLWSTKFKYNQYLD